MAIDALGDPSDAAHWPSATARAAADPARDLATADAALLIRRVGDALGDLALTVDGLQAGLGPTVAAAAAQDAAVLLEAQKLDLVSQSLRGLMDFLAAVGERRVGQEPLHLDRVAASLTLKSLADRLAGVSPDTAGDEADWF